MRFSKWKGRNNESLDLTGRDRGPPVACRRLIPKEKPKSRQSIVFDAKIRHLPSPASSEGHLMRKDSNESSGWTD